MTQRRDFFRAASAVALGAATLSRAGAATLPEAPIQSAAATVPPPPPPNGRPFNPVVTLNGWSLPWRMNKGVKEFHLVCEPVVREFAPGMKVNMWGFNGSSPGPTIEAVEGDRIRIFVTNRLPEPTAIHGHGLMLPSGMDGVSGLTQPGIPVGKTFVYEFDLLRPGSHFYHTHLDEQLQLAMGLYGSLIVHPRDPRQLAVDRDYMFIMAAYDVEPGAMTPKISTMTDFNMWTWNNRIFPGIDPFVARSGERVRIRIGNLTMTNHPIHMHGPHFEVTGTDGGWVPKAARWPEVTVDVGVGQIRAIEFDAVAGDWAIHCHKAHHTMGAMGHAVPTMLGVDQRGLAERIARLVPDYMAMGEKGMHEMAEMEMPLPGNTLPMMAGQGPFGPIGMGGMMSVVKVRDDLRPGDFRDPGPYRHPPGTVAREYTGTLGEAPRAPGAPAASAGSPAGYRVHKPGGAPGAGGHSGHGQH